MYNKDSLKQELTIDKMVDILSALGGNPSPRGETIVLDTICHNRIGEGSHKLYYYDNTKLFRCYTACSDYFDIFELIIKHYEIQKGEEVPLPKAMKMVAEMADLTHLEESGFILKELEDWEVIRRYEPREVVERKMELETIDARFLDVLPQPSIHSWVKEGISLETMKEFNIRYYPKECQIVIPHWNKNGEVVGVRGRTLVEQDADLYGKYIPLRVAGKMYNHPLGMYLYGLNFSKENIKYAKRAIVFESEKSVMMYRTLFGKDNNIAVACCGSSFSVHQFQLLQEMGVEEVVIAFDRQFKEIGDFEFKVHTRNIQRIVDKFKNEVQMSCMFDKFGLLDYKQAPIEKGVDVFQYLFKHRIVF